MLRFFLVLTLIFPAPLKGGGEGYVSTRGSEIIAPDGSTLILRGIGLGNWLVPEGYMFAFDSATSPRMINDVIGEIVGPGEARAFWKTFRDNYITREDIRFIQKTGLNSVRVPFSWRLFFSEEFPEARTQEGFEMLDRVIGWCREEGLWVVLDMHCAPGGQTGDNIDDSRGYPFLFDSPTDQDLTIRLWRSIAERYSGERTVVGYDLLNEPIPHFVDHERLNPLLEPLYRRIVAAIREVDPYHLVFLGGAQWDTNFKVFGPPFDPRAVYTFHKYWCDTTQAMVQEYVDYREKYQVPVWMGESGENTDVWVGAFRKLQERNGIGWSFWPYKKIDSPRAMVTFEKPEGWDMIAEYAAGPRSGYRSIRSRRPPVEEARAALREFLRLCKFENCRQNAGYLQALGLAPVR